MTSAIQEMCHSDVFVSCPGQRLKSNTAALEKTSAQNRDKCRQFDVKSANDTRQRFEQLAGRFLASIRSWEALRAFYTKGAVRWPLHWGRVYTSDELSMYGMHHRLKPVMCTKFDVDVVEVVAKGLQADAKCPSDFARILAF